MDDAPDEKKSMPIWAWGLTAILLIILVVMIFRNWTAVNALKAGSPKPRIKPNSGPFTGARATAKSARARTPKTLSEGAILKWSKGAFVQ